MAVTPTSSAAIAVNSFRRQIAASPTFQTRTGAANTAAALAHVYVGECIDDQDDLGNQSELLASKRPFAVVALDEQGWQPDGESGAGTHLAARGAIVIALTDTARNTDIEGDDELADSETNFLNFIYGIFDEIAEMDDAELQAERDGGSYVAMLDIELIEYDRAQRDERNSDDWWCGVFRVSYGVI